jgi:hypothetical protein
MLLALQFSLNDAINHCLVRKMQLLSLETKDEMQCISSYYKDHSDKESGGANVGGKLLLSQNNEDVFFQFISFVFPSLEFFWTSGKEISSDRVTWCSTNTTTNTSLPTANTESNCIAVNTKTSSLSQENCDEPLNFICEVSNFVCCK